MKPVEPLIEPSPSSSLPPAAEEDAAPSTARNSTATFTERKSTALFIPRKPAAPFMARKLEPRWTRQAGQRASRATDPSATPHGASPNHKRERWLEPPQPIKVRFSLLLRRAVFVISQLLIVIFRVRIAELVDRKPGNVRRRARLWRQLLARLGGIYVKVGQFLAVRTDVLPWEMCAEFSALLDSAPPFSSAQARAVLEAELQAPVEEIFSHFESQPVAAASLSQVHVAYLKESQTKVAVKILRPKIEEKITIDLRLLVWLAKLGDFLRMGSGVRNLPLMREFQRIVEEELSLIGEARACADYRKTVKKRKHMYAPKVYFQHTSERVLTMEFIEGIPLSTVVKAIEGGDMETLARCEASGIDRKVLARRLYREMMRQAFEHDIAHADPHPGNIFVMEGNRLGMIDFGAMSYYGPSFRMRQERILLATAQKDVDACVEAVLASWEPLPPRDIDLFRNEIKPIFQRLINNSGSKHGDPRWKSSGQVSNLVNKIAADLGLNPPSDQLRYNRMLAEVDGVVVTLDPGFNYLKEARRYFMNREKRRLKQVLREPNIKQSALTAVKVITQLPADVEELRYHLYAALQHGRHLYMSVMSKASYFASLLLDQALWLLKSGVFALPVARVIVGADRLEAFLDRHMVLSMPWWAWAVGGVYAIMFLSRLKESVTTIPRD